MFDWIRTRFVRSARTLDDIPLDELRREQVRLEQQEKKLVKEIDDLESRKRALFADSKHAQGAKPRLRSIAIKIKSVDDQGKMTDRKLRTISKQLQAISNFIYLKQSKRELEQSGIFGVINTMDIEDLDAWIERASIDGQLNVERLEDMLRRVNSSMNLADDIDEDPEIASIMALLERGEGGEMEGFDALDESPLETPVSEF